MKKKSKGETIVLYNLKSDGWKLKKGSTDVFVKEGVDGEYDLLKAYAEVIKAEDRIKVKDALGKDLRYYTRELFMFSEGWMRKKGKSIAYVKGEGEVSFEDVDGMSDPKFLAAMGMAAAKNNGAADVKKKEEEKVKNVRVKKGDEFVIVKGLKEVNVNNRDWYMHTVKGLDVYYPVKYVKKSGSNHEVPAWLVEMKNKK